MRYQRYDQFRDVCCIFLNVAVPKSQPIAYAQLTFYLHRLGDTDAVTATIKVINSHTFCLYCT